MHEDLSVFSDETLAGLHEDISDLLDDGIDSPRTRRLLKLVQLELSRRVRVPARCDVNPGMFAMSCECPRQSSFPGGVCVCDSCSLRPF